MSANVQGVQVPEGATVDLKIEITAQVNITAFVAQQKVTQFVISEISNQLCGEKRVRRGRRWKSIRHPMKLTTLRLSPTKERRRV
jgi:hypothetical protein